MALFTCGASVELGLLGLFLESSKGSGLFFVLGRRWFAVRMD